MEDFESFFEQQLENGAQVDEDSKQKFMDLLNKNNIYADEDLLEKWKAGLEAIFVNKSKFGKAELQSFQTEMLKNVPAKETAKKPQQEHKGNQDIFLKMQQSAAKENTTSRNNNSIKKADHSNIMDADEKFRSTKGVLNDPKKYTFNAHLPLVDQEIKTSLNSRSVVAQSLFQKVSSRQSSGFLYNRVEETKKKLAERIEAFKTQYFSKYLSVNESFVNDIPIDSVPKSIEIKVVGRMVASEKGVLNKTNAMIELSKSQYFDLLFDDDFNFQENVLFSNQIVMIQGILTDVHNQLRVSQVVTSHFARETPVIEPAFSNGLQAEEAQLIMVAAGPFQTKLSAQSAPFYSIIGEAKKRRASVLILCGPFLDQNNEVMNTGVIEIGEELFTFERFQNSLFEFAFTQLGDSTHIIIVPSSNDILNLTSVPQAPLSIPLDKKKNLLHSLSNPAFFKLDEELSMFLANNDVAMNTIQNAILNQTVSFTEQAKRAYQALFNQDNLYALHPFTNPLIPRISDSISLPQIYEYDVPFGREDPEQRKVISPDIIISPSSLPKFSFVVQNTLVINPSFLVRDGVSPGSFVVITYFRNSSLPILQRIRSDFYTLQSQE